MVSAHPKTNSQLRFLSTMFIETKHMGWWIWPCCGLVDTILWWLYNQTEGGHDFRWWFLRVHFIVMVIKWHHSNKQINNQGFNILCSQGDNTSGSLLADTSRALTNLFSHTKTVTTWRCCIRCQLPICWVILKGKKQQYVFVFSRQLVGQYKKGKKNMMHSFSIRQFVQQNPVSRVLWSNVWPHHYLWTFNVLGGSYEQYQHLLYLYIYININNYQYYHKCTYIQTQTISTMIWMFTKYINIY